jgi:hypothetical protein
LGHPANRSRQALIKALLCAGQTYEEVGKWCGISSKVIKVYAHLFFDFAERRDDHSFVLKILNPRAQLSILQAETNKSQDAALLLMRIGYGLGRRRCSKSWG